MSREKLAQSFALQLLARRDYSVYQMRTRLHQRGFEASVVEAVIQQLVNKELLNEQRFVQSYVQMRINRGFGPRRIKAELQQRGVAAALIDKWVCDQDKAWLQRALDAAEKKFKVPLPQSRQTQLKQQQFLYYRGFTAEQACRAVASNRNKKD